MMVPGLDQKCGIEDDDTVRLPVTEMPYPGRVDLENLRVEALVQPFPFIPVREHELSQSSAVDRPVRKQDPAAEMVKHSLPGLLVRFKQFVNNGVRIDKMSAEVLEDPRHQAFPAGNAAGKSDNEHGSYSSPDQIRDAIKSYTFAIRTEQIPTLRIIPFPRYSRKPFF